MALAPACPGGDLGSILAACLVSTCQRVLFSHSASDGYLYIYNRMICDRTMKVLELLVMLSSHPPPHSIFHSTLPSPTLLFPSSPIPPHTPSLHTLPLPSLLPPQIDAHQDDANAVAIADTSSQIIYSGGDDGICKVWDRRTLSETRPTPVGILAGHKDGITYIDAKVWTLTTGTPTHPHTHTPTYPHHTHAHTTHTHTTHPPHSSLLPPPIHMHRGTAAT